MIIPVPCKAFSLPGVGTWYIDDIVPKHWKAYVRGNNNYCEIYFRNEDGDEFLAFECDLKRGTAAAHDCYYVEEAMLTQYDSDVPAYIDACKALLLKGFEIEREVIVNENELNDYGITYVPFC